MREGKDRVFLMILVTAMLISFCAPVAKVSATPPQGVLKQAIHWGISADYLDPASAPFVTSHLPLYLFHDALVKPMPQGLHTPSLAESWTVSADAKIYEFKIRQGVKFHNGDPLTAEDVVFSFWRYRGPHAKTIQGKTEKAEVVNPYLVRFHFKTPFPDFFEYLVPGSTSIQWVVPKKYVEKVGDAGFRKNPVGCGPYKFVEFVPGVKLVAEAFEGYWRKIPSIKRMEFYLVPDPATRLAMVRRGEVDIATLMQGVFYEDVKKDPKLRLFISGSSTTWGLYMTSQTDPKSPWSDIRVRKAASLAIDRKTLADIFMPGMGPATSMAMEGDPNGVQFPPDPYDPVQAKKLLAEAGYPDGFHGGKFYPFESGYWPYGEQVANYWKAVGITVDTMLLDRPAFLALRQGGKLQGSVFIDPIGQVFIGSRLSYIFGSPSYGSYPDIQGLWKQYNQEVSPTIRKDLISRIQKVIHEKLLLLTLTPGNSPAAFGPRVKGNPYRVQPLLWFTCPLEDVELVR
jgi:peptide/nickel transport system substrate-binding protein